MDSQHYNLTHGDVIGKLLQVAVPIIGTQLLLMGYNLVDMLLLGRVGSNAVAASGAAGMYMWLANGVMLVGRMGAEIGVAQSVGKKDRAGAAAFARNAVFLSLALGLFYGLICIIAPEKLIGFLAIQEADVAGSAVKYLFIVGLGMPAIFAGAVIAGIFTGVGNSRIPLFVNLLGLGLNAIVDSFFIFTMVWGVEGAAVATVIAQYIATIVAIYCLYRRSSRPVREFSLRLRPDYARIKTILTWSIPMSIESMLFSFMLMVITRFVADFGAGAIAVYRVGTQLESLCWLVCIGFASGITAFVGQNYGAHLWQRIRHGLRNALAILFFWGVLVTVLFLLAGRQLTAVIVPETEIIRMGSRFLAILALCQVFGCLEAVAAGAFRGVGKTIIPSITSIVSNGLRLPLAYFLSRGELGIEGVWWAISLGATLRGLWVFVWFYVDSRHWPKMQLERLQLEQHSARG